METSVWTDPDLFQYYYRYYYDDGGNLLSKQLLLCGEEDWDVVQEDVYTYAETGWKDLLVEFNGETITYDAIGNPLSYYGGRSFTWEGRELKTLTNGDTTASYVYNESGIRTSKTVDGVTTNYLLEGSRIIFQTVGSTRWSFLYYGDELTGFEVGGETYYYLKNLQGDILQIVDEDGEIVVEYLYDDWGELLSIEGELSDTLGEENPFRYRGYYFDSESGLYYRNSRYYDPETGRFISADSQLSDDILGNNIFAYCSNNPVNRIDDNGHGWWIIAGIAVGFMVGGVAKVISNAVSGNKWNEGVLAAAVGGAVYGGVLSATGNIIAAGFTSAATESLFNQVASYTPGLAKLNGNNSIKEFTKQNIVNSSTTVILETAINGVISSVTGELANKIIPTNNGWFKPQKFISSFTGKYAIKSELQSLIQGGMLLIVDMIKQIGHSILSEHQESMADFS